MSESVPAEHPETENSAKASVVSAPTDPVQTQDLIESYHVVAEWIRFADAKAAAVLTAGGILASLIIPTLREYLDSDATHPTLWWSPLVIITFVIWLTLTGLSAIWAFRCISPFRRRGKHPALDHCQHFHPAAICTSYQLDESEKFIDDFGKLGASGLRKEVAAGLLIDSHISGAKYQHVTLAIKLLGLSALFGLTYMLLIQF